MAEVTLTIEVEVLQDQATYGEWCDSCCLPSGYTVPVIMTSAAAFGMRIATWWGCADCGNHYPQ